MTKINWILRIVFFVAAICAMLPGTFTDLIGLGVAAVALIIQCIVAKKAGLLSIRNI